MLRPSFKLQFGSASTVRRLTGAALAIVGGLLTLTTSSTIAATVLGRSTNQPSVKQSTTQTPLPTTQPPITSGTRFSCQLENGQYTVMYSPESQPGQVYPWATPTQLGGGWSPDRRCNEISRRLEQYRPDGLLEMQTGLENGYNTVCVTTQRNTACRIVLTVPPGQDPLATRDRVFENLAVADSGQRTDAVNTYTGNNPDILDQIGQVLNLPSSRPQSSSSINLRPFLDRADGGTGARLRQGAAESNPRLDPNRFR